MQALYCTGIKSPWQSGMGKVVAGRGLGGQFAWDNLTTSYVDRDATEGCLVPGAERGGREEGQDFGCRWKAWMVLELGPQ